MFSDKGPWQLSAYDGRSIESDDFTHDVTIAIHGEFESEEQRRAYAQGLADLLNKYGEEE